MTWYQEWFGEEYLELYAHRDEEEARQQVAFFARICGALNGPVLDLACGMGRHVQELEALNYHAVGCDRGECRDSHPAGRGPPAPCAHAHRVGTAADHLRLDRMELR